MRRIFITVGVLALASATMPPMAQDAPALSIRLQVTLDDFFERYAFRGATAAIALPDVTVVAAATAAVLALESEGTLSRADLLSAHLGNRRWFGTLPNADSITIGQLVHHTSGPSDHVYLPAFQQEWPRLVTGEDDFDPVHLLAFVAGVVLLFEAGTAWAYGDTGNVLPGLAIEEVTERPWQEVIFTRFLEPLGLSGTIPSDSPDLPGLAIGYVAPDNPFGLSERTADADGRLLWNPAVESAGGGFASTSADLARWGHLLFGGTAMDAPYPDRLLDGVPVDPDVPGIVDGAGVAIYMETGNGSVYGHGGWIPAYGSSLRRYADHAVTVALQINTDSGAMGDLSELVPPLEAALAKLAIEAVR